MINVFYSLILFNEKFILLKYLYLSFKLQSNLSPLQLGQIALGCRNGAGVRDGWASFTQVCAAPWPRGSATSQPRTSPGTPLLLQLFFREAGPGPIGFQHPYVAFNFYEPFISIAFLL